MTSVRLWSCVLALVWLVSGVANAQPVSGEQPRYFGTTGEESAYDTAAHEQISKRAQKSAGLLEGPIDPHTYHIGPNDQLHVSIWTTKTQAYELFVSPDAKLLVPTVGEIDVGELTLAEADSAVNSAVRKKYRVGASLALSQVRKFKVWPTGAVKFTDPVTATPLTRVSEVIDLAGGALQRGDKRKITIIRRFGVDDRREIKVDLLPYFSQGNLDANPYVRDGDIVRVGIVDEDDVVQIYGEVLAEGEYTFHEGDSISTMIRAAFGPTVDAWRDSILLVSVGEQGETLTESYHSLRADGSVTNDRALSVGDRIFVRPKPNYRKRRSVVLKGELMRPGVYPIKQGQTKLLDVLNAAGGFTEEASFTDATLIRRRDQGEPDDYFKLIREIDPEKRTEAESEYYRTWLLEYQKQGVMPVEFDALIEGDQSQNILLVDKDSLFVPKRVNYIRVSGKVKNPGHFVYEKGAPYSHYIAVAGGYGWKSDEGETQVIKKRTGDRVPAEDEEQYYLEPGDAIFVPEEKPGNFWTGFTTGLTVLANLATITAVVVSITDKQ